MAVCVPVFVCCKRSVCTYVYVVECPELGLQRDAMMMLVLSVWRLLITALASALLCPAPAMLRDTEYDSSQSPRIAPEHSDSGVFFSLFPRRGHELVEQEGGGENTRYLTRSRTRWSST